MILLRVKGSDGLGVDKILTSGCFTGLVFGTYVNIDTIGLAVSINSNMIESWNQAISPASFDSSLLYESLEALPLSLAP